MPVKKGVGEGISVGVSDGGCGVRVGVDGTGMAAATIGVAVVGAVVKVGNSGMAVSIVNGIGCLAQATKTMKKKSTIGWGNFKSINAWRRNNGVIA